MAGAAEPELGPLASFLLLFMVGEYAVLKWAPLVPAKPWSLKAWQLALVAVISVLLFFPVFWLFSALAGADWGAGIAAVVALIGFPVVGLRLFSARRTH